MGISSPHRLHLHVSILAPAYNEGQNIVQNAQSLLSLHYGKFEVILINDGSKDDTLEKLIHFLSWRRPIMPITLRLKPSLSGVFTAPKTCLSVDSLSLIRKMGES